MIVTLLAVLLTACTSESEVEQLRAEIAELRTELAAEQVFDQLDASRLEGLENLKVILKRFEVKTVLPKDRGVI